MCGCLGDVCVAWVEPRVALVSKNNHNQTKQNTEHPLCGFDLSSTYILYIHAYPVVHIIHTQILGTCANAFAHMHNTQNPRHTAAVSAKRALCTPTCSPMLKNVPCKIRMNLYLTGIMHVCMCRVNTAVTESKVSSLSHGGSEPVRMEVLVVLLDASHSDPQAGAQKRKAAL